MDTFWSSWAIDTKLKTKVEELNISTLSRYKPMIDCTKNNRKNITNDIMHNNKKLKMKETTRNSIH